MLRNMKHRNVPPTVCRTATSAGREGRREGGEGERGRGGERGGEGEERGRGISAI